MDRPIQKGDMVMVIRTCCAPRAKPSIFTVVDMLDWRGRGVIRCSACDRKLPQEMFVASDQAGKFPAFPISWVKRLDPGVLDEELTEREEAPA